RELQTELDLPRIRKCASNAGGRSDPFTRRREELDGLRDGTGPVEIRVVKHVECFGTKLHALVLEERNVLHHGKIEVSESRPDDGIPPQIPVKSSLRQTKRARIEVEIRSPQFRSGGNARTTFRNACYRIVAEARKQIGP